MKTLIELKEWVATKVGNIQWEPDTAKRYSHSIPKSCWGRSEKFKVSLMENTSGDFLLSIDLRCVFNKFSQMPIHCPIPNKGLSRRKESRLDAAIKHLVDNRRDAGRFFGTMHGFDDLDWMNYAEFQRAK